MRVITVRVFDQVFLIDLASDKRNLKVQVRGRKGKDESQKSSELNHSLKRLPNGRQRSIRTTTRD